MKVVENPHRGAAKLAMDAPYPSTNYTNVSKLLSKCPAAGETLLSDARSLAPVDQFWVKDERSRMNLGSFKALGAAYVIACHAAEIAELPDETTLKGRTYVTASAGNHGMSVAVGAKVFGAASVIFIAETVPESFATRLEARGATVKRVGKDYAASMEAAQMAALDHGWILLSDSSWEDYYDLPHRLMEGYLQMAAEAADQLSQPPTHIMLQAGVGGLAGAVAAYARKVWGDAPQIVVVEPEAAPALQASILAGKSVFADGPDSIMGRLDCKEPSLIALNGLARDADIFLTLPDDAVARQLPAMSDAGFATSASGGAGMGAVMDGDARAALGISSDARVLCFLSETEA